MNIVNILKSIGCKNAMSDGVNKISVLRDKKWVKWFKQLGYDKGELIFPDGGHSSFLLVLPDGNIGTGENFMCANGYLCIAEELGLDFDEIWMADDSPQGEFICDENDEEHFIHIFTPQEFMQIIEKIRRAGGSPMTNESRLNRIISECVDKVLENRFKNPYKKMVAAMHASKKSKEEMSKELENWLAMDYAIRDINRDRSIRTMTPHEQEFNNRITRDTFNTKFDDEDVEYYYM